jgi:glycosyltransferase involved in cell wall biosynthesis
MFSPFSFSMASSTHRLVSFAEELVKSGNEVCIVLPSFDRHSNFKMQKLDSFHGVRLIQPYQPRIHAVELSTMPYIVTSFLKEFPINYDVMHVLKPLPITCAPYLLKQLKRTPIVQDMDDLDHNVMIAEKQSRSRVQLVEYCERILPRLSDHITTCSSSLKQIYVNIGFKNEKITWIPNGVKTSDFDINPQISLKKEFALRDKVVVYLGSLNNQVQVYPLIKAMELVVKERNDVSCMIIGDGTARSFFEQLTENLRLSDYVKFTGHIPYDDVARYLSVSDVGFACFPPPLASTGGALKVFMYMASGLPVIVNPVGDLPYYIDFGKAGIVSQLNPQSLSVALLELLGDDTMRRKKGQYARAYVRENFDWSVLTTRLLKIYRDLSG